MPRKLASVLASITHKSNGPRNFKKHLKYLVNQPIFHSGGVSKIIALATMHHAVVYPKSFEDFDFKKLLQSLKGAGVLTEAAINAVKAGRKISRDELLMEHFSEKERL